MKSYLWRDKKLIGLGVALILVTAFLVICIVGVSSAFAVPIAPESSVDVMSAAPSKIPSWPPVYEEKMADGTTWYAYASCNVEDWTTIKDGEDLILTNKHGTFPATIKIFNPQPQSASSGGRSPERVWITFKSILELPKLPKTGPAVLFKVR